MASVDKRPGGGYRARWREHAGGPQRTRQFARKADAVRFLDGRRRIATARHGVAGLYSVTWRAPKARHGRHRLRAVALSRRGRAASASRAVRVCR